MMNSMVKMNDEAREFVAKWNAAQALSDREERQDAWEDLYIEFRENGMALDFHILESLAESLHRGNEMPVITELGGCYDAECYSEFFKEYGIDRFAFCTKSTAAVSDMVTFLKEGWEVAGTVKVKTRFDGEQEAILFK